LTQIAQFRAHRHDDWGLGLNHKHRLARHSAWFASLSFSGDVGPLAQLPSLPSLHSLHSLHSARRARRFVYFHR